MQCVEVYGFKIIVLTRNNYYSSVQGVRDIKRYL